jgi:hypothetical protein
MASSGARYTRDMSEADLPVACALTAADLAARRAGLLPGLAASARETSARDDGRAWRFTFEQGLLPAIALMIQTEHRCCPFLRFALTVGPGDGPVTLEVTGPQGTQEFLESLLGDDGA